MDTSKEYIKMCRKAVEIQKAWDMVVNPKDFVVRKGKVADATLKIIWLPRQDQLQEIATKYNEYNYWYETFQDFLRFYGNENIDNIHSMEQLWLAFIMHEKYGKKWDGSDWQEIIYACLGIKSK